MNNKNSKNFIDESLRKIYTDERRTDFASLEYKKSGRLKKYLTGLIIILVLALGGSWAYFIFFGGQKEFVGGDITLEFSGPKEIIVGQKNEYILKYKNGESLALGAATIEVKIPKDFFIDAADPAAGPDGFWRIGAIPSGRSGEIKFSGEVWDSLGASSVWQAVLTYRPENFNADFEKVATYPAIIKESRLGISVEGPDKIVPGQEIAYKVNFQNKGEEDIDNVEIHAAYPAGFVFKEAAAPPGGGNNVWMVGRLKAGAGSSLTVRGSFAADASGQLPMLFNIGVRRGNEYLKQAESSMPSEVAVSGFLLGLKLGNSAESRPVSFGDTLDYLLAYKNQGTDILENIELKFALLSPTVFGGETPILMETLSAEPGGVAQGGAIVWDKKKISRLAKMLPGDEGTISIRVKLRDAPFPSSEIKDYKIMAAVSAKIGKAGNLASGLNIALQPLTSPILSDAAFLARAAYYNNGVAVGFGPLPPKAGETTTYRVYFEITNSLHEISGIEASAVLLAGVNFTGRYNVEAGELTYNSADRRVTWKLNRLPLSVPKIGIDFEVALTPLATDAGKVLLLATDNLLLAKDTFNGGQITKSQPALDTGLAGDAMAAGKGIVTK